MGVTANFVTPVAIAVKTPETLWPNAPLVSSKKTFSSGVLKKSWMLFQVGLVL